MIAYYNEFDPKAAAWLRELIAAGLIAPGVVDERSISDVTPGDLAGFTQCHFFAGIGVWSHALRKAGWANDRPVWTGSCPCQPFSAAGKGGGFDDERHLWPDWHHLLRVCAPPVVFGEQVSSKDGLTWLDLVSTDLEGLGYAFGAISSNSAGVGAPHIRQRLYWVADSGGARPAEQQRGRIESTRPTASSATGGVADTECQRVWTCGSGGAGSKEGEVQGIDGERERVRPDAGPSDDGMGAKTRPTAGFWRDADWLGCRDGKWRPVEPGTFPLVNGASARVVRLRGYGNAINAVHAQTFIESYLEC